MCCWDRVWEVFVCFSLWAPLPSANPPRLGVRAPGSGQQGCGASSSWEVRIFDTPLPHMKAVKFRGQQMRRYPLLIGCQNGLASSRLTEKNTRVEGGRKGSRVFRSWKTSLGSVACVARAGQKQPLGRRRLSSGDQPHPAHPLSLREE